VLKYARLGPSLVALPAPFDTLIGRPISPDLTKDVLKGFLTQAGIDETEVGGPISSPVSHTNSGEAARYFIIHDTSSPTYESTQAIPSNINEAGWSGNGLENRVAGRKAHLFINRVGESATAVNFDTAYRTTKYELQDVSRKGLFIGVELVQPRRRDVHGIDAEAPQPGFTQAQLDRLALVYIAASVRRGEWLIPAFHATIDDGISADSHDDPQNFDLEVWANSLDRLVTCISAS
jgi:hypothetical protein